MLLEKKNPPWMLVFKKNLATSEAVLKQVRNPNLNMCNFPCVNGFQSSTLNTVLTLFNPFNSQDISGCPDLHSSLTKLLALP